QPHEIPDRLWRPVREELELDFSDVRRDDREQLLGHAFGPSTRTKTTLETRHGVPVGTGALEHPRTRRAGSATRGTCPTSTRPPAWLAVSWGISVKLAVRKSSPAISSHRRPGGRCVPVRQSQGKPQGPPTPEGDEDTASRGGSCLQSSGHGRAHRGESWGCDRP